MIGIVTFNPEVELFRRCIESAVSQSSLVTVVDNGSSNVGQIREVCDKAGVRLVQLAQNRGVAAALNQILKVAEASRNSEVLLLDQDSILSPGSMSHLLETIAEPDVAIAVASVHERNTGNRQVGSSEINYCITSGSLVRVATWLELGGYDESMFVDFVDFDFSARIRVSGRRIVRDGRATLDHAIGESEQKRLGKIYNYSPFRLRHMAADMTYFSRKHRHTPRRLLPPRTSRVGVTAVLVRKAMLIALYEHNRRKKLMALARGAVEGSRTQMPNALANVGEAAQT